MEFNSPFMNILVEAHQENLRNGSRPPTTHGGPGPFRKALGTWLILLGAKLSGTTPAPAPTSVVSTLATS